MSDSQVHILTIKHEELTSSVFELRPGDLDLGLNFSRIVSAAPWVVEETDIAAPCPVPSTQRDKLPSLF